MIRTTAIGFAGATQEDQVRWLSGFRHLVDGLDAPLQAVMSFLPGGAAQGARSRAAATGSRALDLAFADDLAASHEAQARTVAMVTAGHAAGRLAEQLRRLGVEPQVAGE
ncbi:MAG: hypothetical protein ACREPI_01245, partial [Candidatus Dormibacterales bacterium]